MAHRQRAGIMVLILLMGLLVPAYQPPPQAAMAVIDAAAIMQIVGVLTEVSKTVRQGAQHLSAYSEFPYIFAAVTDAQRLVVQLDRFASRMTTRINYWTGLDIPRTPDALKMFRYNTRGLCWAAARDGMGMQATVRDLSAILKTLVSLINNVSRISGTVAGAQSTHGVLSSINSAQVSLAGLQAGMNETDLCRIMTQKVEDSVAADLGPDVYYDWGAYTPIF